MKQAKDFLSRFKKITPPDDSVRRAVVDAIKSVARVPVALKNIRIQNGVAFVNCSSIAKNVIRTERAGILALLARGMYGVKTTVRDIR